jgi:hypothetical protein
MCSLGFDVDNHLLTPICSIGAPPGNGIGVCQWHAAHRTYSSKLEIVDGVVVEVLRGEWWSSLFGHAVAPAVLKRLQKKPPQEHAV